MGVIGEDNHAVWVFALVLLLNTFEQGMKYTRRSAIWLTRKQAIRRAKRQVCIYENHQGMRSGRPYIESTGNN
jgi:hypothetical protein